jgi:broad specificity phosphatase PhoE
MSLELKAPLRIKEGITLYLSRHGQTVANEQHRFSGKRDTPLTPLGLTQAAAIGHILEREVGLRPALNFVCSPLARAQSTMKIVRRELGLPEEGFTTDPRIQEIDLGEWDQLTDDEARARDPTMFAARGNDKWHVRVPGGENYAEVAARVSDWIGGLAADTFAVSHGACTRILRGLLLGLSWQDMSGLDEPQGVVFRIRGDQVTLLDA